MGQGSDLNDAIIIGKAVAEAQAHTWAQRIKKDNAILRATGVPATAGGHAGAATSVAAGGRTGATGPAAATTKATSVAAGGHTGAAAARKLLPLMVPRLVIWLIIQVIAENYLV